MQSEKFRHWISRRAFLYPAAQMDNQVIINNLETEIVILTTTTINRLLSFDADCLTLYVFLCNTAKMQAAAVGRYINQVKATDGYCMKGLGWGEDKLRRTKTILKDEGFIRSEVKKDDTGKIIGHYIWINYLMKNHNPQNPGLDETRTGFQRTNTNNKNINTNNKNINTQSSEVPAGDTNKKMSQEDLESTAGKIIDHYNQIYDSKYRSSLWLTSREHKNKLSYLDYWLKSYSVDEIKQSITNSKLDDFWKDKLTPVILFRMSNPNKEPVDYIGKFLNLQQASFDRTALTDIRLWELSGQLNVHPDAIKDVYQKMLENVEKNGKLLERYKNLEDALIGWVGYGLKNGTLQPMNESEILDYPLCHPDEVAKREEAFRIMREMEEQE